MGAASAHPQCPAPPSPSCIKLLARTADQLTLEWRVADPKGAPVKSCEVQIAGSWSWSLAAFEIGKEPVRAESECWRVTVASLASNTTYEIRVRGVNDGGDGFWLSEHFSTSESPAAPSGLRCDKRFPDKVALVWHMSDPDGAPVDSCQVELAASTRWTAAIFEECAEPRRLGADQWQATVATLSSNTAYNIRVRGTNAAGDGVWSPALTCMTSESPSEPWNVICTRRSATKLSFEWELADPEGAPVASCDIQLGGSIGWSATVCDPAPYRAPNGRWCATVTELASNTTHALRFRGCSEAGEGRWGAQVDCMTSEVPADPSSVACVSRFADRICLTWCAADREGAPITECEIQVGGSLSWCVPAFLQGDEPHKVEGELWRATLAELIADTVYEVCIRAKNEAGDGRWSPPMHFRTSEKPAEPFDICCDGRMPDRLSLVWRVADPEGAVVESCEVDVGGSVSWASATFERCPERVQHDRWRATVRGLVGNTRYSFRIRACNAIGAGAWALQEFITCEPPDEPYDVRCCRFVDKLSLAWRVAEPEGSAVSRCKVELGGKFGWSVANLAADSEPEHSQDGQWHATVMGLSGDTEYAIRICGVNAVGDGKWLQKTFKTSENPSESTDFHCSERLADRLSLKWKVADPEGAKVTSCALQIGSPLGWTDVTFGEGAEPRRRDDGHWLATLSGLSGDTVYDVRVCGINVVGAGTWAQQQFRTSETPAPPYDLQCVQRRPTKLSLAWSVDGTEGAAVTSCDVQVLGSLSWVEAQLEDRAAAKSAGGTHWSATLCNLIGAAAYDVRIRGCNAAGVGKWVERRFHTSDTPSAPSILQCSRRQAHKFHLEWHIADPDGAEVLGCEVQIFASMWWADAAYEQGAEPQRTRDGWWRATVKDLDLDTTYGIHVRGRNGSGYGEWSDKLELRTQGKPEKPFDIKWEHTELAKVTLEWRVVDPDGAAVSSCEVELLVTPAVGAPYWEVAIFDTGGEPRRIGPETWSAGLVGLANDATFSIRICAHNTGGRGPWVRQEIKTLSLSGRPSKS